MPEISIEEMIGAGTGEVSIEDMLGEETSFEDMIGAPAAKVAPTTEFPTITKPEFAGLPEVSPFVGTGGEELGGIAGKMGIKLGVPDVDYGEIRQGLMETLKGYGHLATHPYEIIQGAVDFVASIPGFLTGVATAMQRMGKNTLDQIVLGQYFNLEELYDEASKGMEAGFQFFEPGKEALFGEAPETSHLVGATAMAPILVLSKVGQEVAEFEGFRDYPNIRGLSRFVGDVSGFLALGALYRGSRGELTKESERIVRKANDIKVREQLTEKITDEQIRKAQLRVLEVQKRQVELKAEILKQEIKKGVGVEKPLKDDLKVKGEKVKVAKVEIVPEAAYKVEPKPTEPGEITDVVREVEPITELDRQTGVPTPPEIEGESNPFFQSPEEAEGFRKLYEGRKSVMEDVELFTQKTINDVNLAYHAGDEATLGEARNTLSQLATRSDEFRGDFITGVDHSTWKENISDAAEWARGLRLKIERRPEGPKLYTGVPIDEMQKAIVDGAKRFKGYVDYAKGVKKFKPGTAAKVLNEEFKRTFIDRSGNIRLELLDKLGMEGYKVVQKMYLTKGANSLSANMIKQMRKEVYSGLSKNEKAILDKVVLAERMSDIGKYKTPKGFAFPEGLRPTESTAYLELFQQLEKLDPTRAEVIRGRAKAYFEWMKRPLKDMLDAELITQDEFNALSTHQYRRIKLVDIFDRRYQMKIGKRRRTVYDSGVESLAKGRVTDIYEPSSEIMALEVFNRAYGRILNNEANKALLDLARSDPNNPFVRYRKKGENIPSGWQRLFVYEGGERKAIHISPEMSKEWIVSNPEMSYRLGQFIRFTSGSPVLRTFATGINWGFALANLPRDVMHVFFAARIFDGSKWKSVYSNQLSIFLPQIGMDLARTFTDAATRGTRYQRYIEEGGGMEFLVHQGSILKRGRRLEGPIDKFQNFMGYFGETSEIMTRLAIRDRVIRRRAREQKISFEEARNNKDIRREATFAARDYMDFGQGGGVTKAFDNGMPYLNAAVQGTRGLWRTAVDNPALFSYKVTQIGAAVVLLYAAMRENAPKTTEALQGDVDMQNNLCIPLGDHSSFEDEKGQTRYMYFKIPLDPSQKFFKAFFEGAYDKSMGYEIDIERITNNLLEQSPVGVSNISPSLSGSLGYMQNKDYWLNEDIWRKTDKPFEWPASKEEYIPGRTPEFFKDVGEVTGLSPERMQYAVEELTTSGTVWSYLLGKGYDEMFKEVPKEKREQHLAMVLSEVPIVKRFFGVTNPYAKRAAGIERDVQDVAVDRWRERRELDRLTEGYLFEKSVKRDEVFKYIRSFREHRTRERLQDRFDFQYAVRNLPERSFWLRLQHLDPEVRARQYHDEMQKGPERRGQLVRERAIIGAAGGFFSDAFWEELNRIRRSEKVNE